jgi:aconitate hydratase
MSAILDSFNSRRTLTVGAKSYEYFSLIEAEKHGLAGVSRLPVSLKVLLENLLRHEDGITVSADDIRAMASWLTTKTSEREIAYRPARVLMQDFTGVPAVVDLAAMRDAMVALGGDPRKINPLVPVDLVIDHSVMVDSFGTPQSFARNVELEYERNQERYEFLRWGSTAFDNFRVVPPGTGICHQVNLEYLAQSVWTKAAGSVLQAFPDTCVGTDSHTTMVNALAVLGWGVGGIEAEAAMLGQPVSMLIPEVIGFQLNGALQEGITATDLQKGRRRKICRVLWRRPGQIIGRRPRHHCQYGTGIRRNLRFLPRRRRHNQVSERDRPGAGSHRADGSLCQGAGHVPRRQHGGTRLHRHAGARS